ncbi:hypothetical protein FNV43_RR16992 [Rhamnella rubrinervis]|uniref:Uncharacterized protein n=1 Tax=Rhamnella rubrinervis TaxID=2594499 RepID=A0A8K0GZS5_9ROSA|nr:hypothetical protein FNV43_RR16992 [Rhamnella rubrinervis]
MNSSEKELIESRVSTFEPLSKTDKRSSDRRSRSCIINNEVDSKRKFEEEEEQSDTKSNEIIRNLADYDSDDAYWLGLDQDVEKNNGVSMIRMLLIIMASLGPTNKVMIIIIIILVLVKGKGSVRPLREARIPRKSKSVVISSAVSAEEPSKLSRLWEDTNPAITNTRKATRRLFLPEPIPTPELLIMSTMKYHCCKSCSNKFSMGRALGVAMSSVIGGVLHHRNLK